VINAAEKKVAELAKTNPVIIFGMPVGDKLKKMLEPGLYSAHLATDDQVKLAVTTASSKLLGVISMVDKYIVGADVRLINEATVVIVAKELPNRVSVNQMTARGVRTI
jgi:hypothetical protein